MNHTRLRRLGIAFAAATLMSAMPVLAQNIAVVNDRPIKKAKADALIARMVQQGQPDSPELQQAVRDDLIKRELLMQEAEKRGLLANPDVQAEIERSRQQVLIGALAQDHFGKNGPTDAELKQQYDTIIGQLNGKEYRARHILVEKEADAKAIIARLKGGASFEDLAKQSKDPGSAARGGDLDWSRAENYVPPFAEALVKLKKGELTQKPVKSDFGWHVIRLDDIRPEVVPSFEEAKPQLAQAMMRDPSWQQTKFQAFLDELRAKARIE